MISIVLVGCKEKKAPNSNDLPTSIDGHVSEADYVLPTLPDDIKRRLFEKCDYVDYLWHDLPFSLSLNDKASITSNLNAIGFTGLTEFPAQCKSIGRKNWQINGEIVIEADVYFTNGCMYYVFIKDEKKIYANQLSKAGVTFYSNLFANARQQMMQGGN